MKKIILLLLIGLLFINCSKEDVCGCEKKLYKYTPQMGSSSTVVIPAKNVYVRSIYNQCGTTTPGFVTEVGTDYNRYLLVCE